MDTLLPLEMKSEQGGAIRVYARERDKLLLEVASPGCTTIANHLNVGAVQALAATLQAWLAAQPPSEPQR